MEPVLALMAVPMPPTRLRWRCPYLHFQVPSAGGQFQYCLSFRGKELGCRSIVLSTELQRQSHVKRVHNPGA